MSLTTGGVSSEPTVRDGVLTRPLLLKLLLAGALSFAVVNLVPRTVSGGGSVPPVRMLIETATIVGVICATLMFWGLRSDLGLPATAAVYAVVFNVLVIVVKLGLAPRGFYEVNQVRNLDGTFSIDNAFGAVLAAGVVFALYLGVYLVLYRSFRARIEHMADPDPIPRFAPGRGAVVGIVDHIHLHVVPRWAGDTNFMPVLADVKVLPEHLLESRRKLAEAWPTA